MHRALTLQISGDWTAMKRKNKKHNVYFDLLEAMGESGCPICSLSRRASARYLAAILNEGVNDPPLRRKLSDSLGFCNAHAWELRDIGDSLATAILYKDLVDLLADNLGSGLEVSGKCPACVSGNAAEKEYLASFNKFIKEKEFMDRYDTSCGLCHAHLAAVLKIVKDERSAGIIKEKEAGKLKELSGQLAEYIRKKDYRNAHESPGGERDSWIRAVEKVAGGRR